MKIKLLPYLLFAILVFLLPSQHHYSPTSFMVQAAESGNKLKLEPGPARNILATRYMLSTWVKSRKLGAKPPSGPSPIGNRHPPANHN